jgi:hypothetical protein
MAIVSLSTTAKNAGTNAIVDLLDGGGTINFYSGTMPATPETAISTQILLATLTLSTPAFAAASGGSAAASAITDDTSADETGVVTWARILNSSSVAVMDVDVGTSGASITLNTTNVVESGTVRITGFSFGVGS